MSSFPLLLAIATSSFGLAFWMPRRTIASRVIFTGVLGIIAVLGVATLVNPGLDESPGMSWAWVAIGVANVIGWVTFITRAMTEDRPHPPEQTGRAPRRPPEP